MITPKQTALIVGFVKVAKVNGASQIEAALPRNHPEMKVHTSGVHMMQIRKVKEWLAVYKDELGNLVVLTTEGIVKQL